MKNRNFHEPGKKRYRIAAFALFCGGAAGLGHELLWIRLFVDLLGGATQTFSVVVGGFFLGLAIGAGAASGTIRPGRAQWRRIAAAELAVVFLNLPILLVYFNSQFLYAGWLPGFFLKTLAVLILVLPSAIAMGCVLPWILHGLSLEGNFNGKGAVWLYAANTLGGILGIFSLTLFGLPRLGLMGSMGFIVCSAEGDEQHLHAGRIRRSIQPGKTGSHSAVVAMATRSRWRLSEWPPAARAAESFSIPRWNPWTRLKSPHWR